MGWGCVCVEHDRGHGEVAEEWGSWESWVGEMLVFLVLGVGRCVFWGAQGAGNSSLGC